jgi:hypothetical protein
MRTNESIVQWMRTTVSIAVLVLASCEASQDIPYATSLPFANPGPTASNTYGAINYPTLWITYPAEARTGCIEPSTGAEPAGGQFLPIWFTMLNPPTGARVRFTWDRYKDGTGVNLGMSDGNNEPFRANLTAIADRAGSHNIIGEIVQADGSALPAQQGSPIAPSPERWGPHKFMVNFTAVVRAIGNGGCPQLRVPANTVELVDPPDDDIYTSGDHIEIEFRVQNLGTTPAPESVAVVRVRTFDEEENPLVFRLGTTPVSEIPVGGSVTASFLGILLDDLDDLPPGEYDILVSVNGTGSANLTGALTRTVAGAFEIE